jgi:hypothetical protein
MWVDFSGVSNLEEYFLSLDSDTPHERTLKSLGTPTGSMTHKEARKFLNIHFGCVFESKKGKGDNEKFTHLLSGVAFTLPRDRTVPEIGFNTIKDQLEKLGYSSYDIRIEWLKFRKMYPVTSNEKIGRMRIVATKNGYGYELFADSGNLIKVQRPHFPTPIGAVFSASQQHAFDSDVQIEIFNAPGSGNTKLQLVKSITYRQFKQKH